MTTPSKVAVIGDGWSALGLIGFLVSSGIEVIWVAGSGARISAPLASVEWGPGVAVISELAHQLGIEIGSSEQGCYLREFRNKAFREPNWMKAPTPEMRKEVRDELLWEPERRFVGAFDSRFVLSFDEIEAKIRKALVPSNFKNLRRIENIPVSGFKRSAEGTQKVMLGSGDELECDQVIYADQWAIIPTLEGLEKPLSFLRKLDPAGLLQATFTHGVSIGSGLSESFFALLGRESGEAAERHVWGYFSSDGLKSTWSICLTPEEAENNHEIAKKFRRMKATLDKMFSSGGFLPGTEGMSFSSTLVGEHVRLVENSVFSGGQPAEDSGSLPQNSGILFLSDGFGVSAAFQQVGAAIGLKKVDLESKAEGVDVLDSGAV